MSNDELASNFQESIEGNEPAYLTRIELGALISRTLACVILTVCFFNGISLAILFVEATVNVPWFGFRLSASLDSLVPLSLGFGMLAAVGLFFWFNAIRIGYRLVGGDTRHIAGMPQRYSNNFLATTIQIIGLILVVEGLRQLAGIIYYTFRLELDTTQYWDTAGTLEVVISLALGFWMLLGSNGISKAITWLRTVGTPLSIHNSDEDSGTNGESA